jgi:hypothetical protein
MSPPDLLGPIDYPIVIIGFLELLLEPKVFLRPEFLAVELKYSLTTFSPKRWLCILELLLLFGYYLLIVN